MSRHLGRTVLALAALAFAMPAFANPACDAASAYSAARHGAAVLVMQNGKVICETFAGEGSVDNRMELASGTKSFTGMMLAAAVQDKLLTLDEPVAKTLPEWREDPVKSQVTIRQLLSLTSGLVSQIGVPPEYAKAITMPLTYAPGERFSYGPGPYQVFGEVMKRKLAAAGQPADPLSYMKRRFLDPLGMTRIQWRRTPGGDPYLPQGAILTAREWAIYGEFVRGGARIKGKAVVDPATFKALFVGSKANPAYGLTWWLPHAPVRPDPVSATADFAIRSSELPADLVVAAGAGNQRLYVIPSRGLTIVRLASFDMKSLVSPRALSAIAGPSDAASRWSDTDFLLTLLPAKN